MAVVPIPPELVKHVNVDYLELLQAQAEHGGIAVPPPVDWETVTDFILSVESRPDCTPEEGRACIKFFNDLARADRIARGDSGSRAAQGRALLRGGSGCISSSDEEEEHTPTTPLLVAPASQQSGSSSKDTHEQTPTTPLPVAAGGQRSGTRSNATQEQTSTTPLQVAPVSQRSGSSNNDTQEQVAINKAEPTASTPATPKTPRGVDPPPERVLVDRIRGMHAELARARLLMRKWSEALHQMSAHVEAMSLSQPGGQGRTTVPIPHVPAVREQLVVARAHLVHCAEQVEQISNNLIEMQNQCSRRGLGWREAMGAGASRQQ